MHRANLYMQCLRLGIQNSGALSNTFSTKFLHTKSSKCNINEERTVVTDDGLVVVCWHPEKPFPYELSKPVPETVHEQNSVLKVQNISEVYDVFKPKKEEFVREELMKITHTTKHRWFPKSRLKYRKPRPPPDREYL